MLALATFTKFAPIVLAPMLATYEARDQRDSAGAAESSRWQDPRPGRLHPCLRAVSALVMLQTILDPGLATFYDRTLGYQAGRDSPFSIWGQVPSLEPLRTAIIVASGLLALALAFVPRRKSLVQVAALGAALMLAVELTAEHWFYLYIVWFLPLVLVALAGLRPRPEPGSARSTPPGRLAEPLPGPPSPRRPPRRSRSEPASA